MIAGRLGRCAGAAVAFALFVLSPGTARPAEEARAVARDDGLVVAVQGDAILLDARDVPLVRILRAVAEQAGFELVVRGDLTAPLTVSFALPLGEALRVLTAGHGLMMVGFVSARDDAQAQVLSRVTVTGRGATPGRASEPVVADPVTVVADDEIELTAAADLEVLLGAALSQVPADQVSGGEALFGSTREELDHRIEGLQEAEQRAAADRHDLEAE
jgi:hypothetical protein